MSPLALVILLPMLLGTSLCFWSGRVQTPARRRLTAWLAAAVTASALALLLAHAQDIFEAGRC